jgi:TRAP-type C4-dicarboxylate transport system substrate-binding protein
VRRGRADLGKVGARAFDLVGVRSLQPLVAPFAVNSYALQRRVLHSDAAERMLAGVSGADVVGVALLPGELRRPIGSTRALLEASDYRGARIATRASALGHRTFTVLGARPYTVRPSGETTRYDGAESGLVGLEGDPYHGPRRTLATNVALWPRALVIVMNTDSYARLTDVQRRALRSAGRAATDPIVERDPRPGA